MTHPISLLGAVHTGISLLPVVAGLYGFARYRAIKPSSPSGKIYLAGLALSVVTSFGLSSSGGFNPGHALGILALIAASGTLFVSKLSATGRLRRYLPTLGLSFSFFLLLVPAINETLTRLPAAHPLADGPKSPLVLGTLLVWVVTFIVGATVQAWSIHSRRRSAAITHGA